MTEHEHVIQGRPELNVDWENQYQIQRRTRLQDSIDEYLQDDKVDARQAYEEMLSCVDDVINYHKKEMDKAVELKSLMMGHRTFQLEDLRNIPEQY
jgi:predicted house-cleaning noncanonical NTP pyrophosphatase (MazG superfamily)